GPQKLEEFHLIFKSRTSRVAERITFSTIFSLKPLHHGCLWRVSKSPCFTNLTMEKLSVGFSGFESKDLKNNRFEVLTSILQVLCKLAHALSDRNCKERDIIIVLTFGRNIVGKTKSICFLLSREIELASRCDIRG